MAAITITAGASVLLAGLAGVEFARGLEGLLSSDYRFASFRHSLAHLHLEAKSMMPPSHVSLRPTSQADLATLFLFQLDPQAAYLAAFMPKDSTDKAAYLERFTRYLRDPTIHTQTILVGGTIVGSIAKFEVAGEAELTYWLDRSCWGKGIATAALTQFLTLEPARPLVGRVAFDNIGSQKVLEKAGFVKIGTDTGFASARQAEIAEFIYRLT